VQVALIIEGVFFYPLAIRRQITILTKLTNEPSQPSRIQNRESMFLNLYISVICICFGFRTSNFGFCLSWHLYTCKEPSTNQPFLCKTNPILSAVGGLQMNINIYDIKDYQIFVPLAGQKNKPNSNPNKPNLRKAKMNVNLTLTNGYRKKDDFTVRINKPNFRNGQNERKLNFNKGLHKKRLFRIPKNKPNSNPISKLVLSAACPERSRMGRMGRMGQFSP